MGGLYQGEPPCWISVCLLVATSNGVILAAVKCLTANYLSLLFLTTFRSIEREFSRNGRVSLLTGKLSFSQDDNLTVS